MRGAEMFVVDDDEAVGRALGRLLRTAGYRVRVFASAQRVLNVFRKSRPGCLIVDVHMPGCGGLELFEMLHTAEAHIPVILITGHGDSALEGRLIKAGAFAVLTKPFEDEVLLDAVAQALARDGRHHPNRVYRRR